MNESHTLCSIPRSSCVTYLWQCCDWINRRYEYSSDTDCFIDWNRFLSELRRNKNKITVFVNLGSECASCKDGFFDDDLKLWWFHEMTFKSNLIDLIWQLHAQTPTAPMMTSYKLLEFNLIQKSVTFELLLINNVIQQQRDNKKVLPFTLYIQTKG